MRRALGSKRGGGRGHRDAELVDPFLCAGCKLRTRCSTVLDEGLLDGDAVFVRRVGAAHRRHELVVQSRDERLPADPSKALQARMSARRKNRTSSSSVTSAGRTGDCMRRGTERPPCGAWVRSIRRGRSGRRAGRDVHASLFSLTMLAGGNNTPTSLNGWRYAQSRAEIKPRWDQAIARRVHTNIQLYHTNTAVPHEVPRQLQLL